MISSDLHLIVIVAVEYFTCCIFWWCGCHGNSSVPLAALVYSFVIATFQLQVQLIF